MIRTKLVIGIAFALALCAGVAVGLVSARLPEQHRKSKGEPRSWLADELNLTPQQREQMQAIWQDFARSRGPGAGAGSGPSTGASTSPQGPGGSPGGREGREGRDGRDERRRFERERNDAILAAITDPVQRRRVEAVMQQFEQRQQDMARERERMFDEAVRKTMAILDEPQRKKYEQILQRRRTERESRNSSSSTNPSTATSLPATSPSARSH